MAHTKYIYIYEWERGRESRKKTSINRKLVTCNERSSTSYIKKLRTTYGKKMRMKNFVQQQTRETIETKQSEHTRRINRIKTCDWLNIQFTYFNSVTCLCTSSQASLHCNSKSYYILRILCVSDRVGMQEIYNDHVARRVSMDRTSAKKVLYVVRAVGYMCVRVCVSWRERV